MAKCFIPATMKSPMGVEEHCFLNDDKDDKLKTKNNMIT